MRESRDNTPETPIGAMNTTPLIDVMLVLLVMFIITIPMQTHAVKIALPLGIDGPDVADKNRIAISPAGVVSWNQTPVTTSTLAELLARSQRLQPQPAIEVEPDAAAPYIVVDTVLATIKRSGVGGMGFVGNERYVREF